MPGSRETVPSVGDEREATLEVHLRPQSMEEFIGQTAVVANLELAVTAARARGESLDHVLLCGLPGLGKTTLAHLVADRMGTHLHEAAAPVLTRAADLAGLLTRLEPGDVLFIDEVHRLPPAVEEYLYAAMEDFVLDIVLDQGPSARSLRIDLPRFTLVGATTREGMLSAPLRDRFVIRERLELYPVESLSTIALRTARLLGVEMDGDGATWLATRARGTPRVVNRFVRRVRDLAQVEGSGRITEALAREGLERIGVDVDGLDRLDRHVLTCLARGGGRPLGLKTIAAAVGEDERTLEDVCEPHLLREGLLVKTSQGRQLTARGWDLVGGPPPHADSTLPLPLG
jgi:Holliday junction DNA helicase RuvB